MNYTKSTFFTLLIAAASFSCQDQSSETVKEVPNPEPEFMNLKSPEPGKFSNARLASGNIAVYSAEYITSGEGERTGNTVYFNNRGNKQLGADFVPGLNLDGTDAISYYVDDTRPSEDLAFSVTESAIERAMNTWDGVTCSDLGMHKTPSNGTSTGYIAAYFSDLFGFSFGGSYEYVADVNHAGWLPREFFDAISAPDGGDYILGVTFTLIFTDDNGDPVDTNGDGKIDVAWREIYYNDGFPWNDGAHYDVETIALHEAGHGLSQGHFGKAFASGGNDKLHFAPRAVMNAAYSGIQTQIDKTDNAGHCSLWSNWANK